MYLFNKTFPRQNIIIFSTHLDFARTIESGSNTIVEYLTEKTQEDTPSCSLGSDHLINDLSRDFGVHHQSISVASAACPPSLKPRDSPRGYIELFS